MIIKEKIVEIETSLGPSKDLNSSLNSKDFSELNTPAISKVVQETSILSKREIEKDGTEKTQKQIVLNFIKNNPDVCIREIGERTDIQKSSVAPRLYKLRKEFKVKLSGQKVYKGKVVMTWKVKNEVNKMGGEAEKAEKEVTAKTEKKDEDVKAEEAEKKEEDQPAEEEKNPAA